MTDDKPTLPLIQFVERLELANEDELIEPFLASVEAALRNELEDLIAFDRLQHIIAEVREQVGDYTKRNGFCNFGHHRTQPEYQADGKCWFCEKDATEHDSVAVCPREYVDDEPPP